MPQILQKIQKNEIEWYRSLPTLAIFGIFFLIFVISVYSCIRISMLIKEGSTMDPDDFEEKYRKSLVDLERAYVFNIIIVILSLIVLLYFVYKSIPFNSPFVYFLTSNAAIFVFALLMLCFSSYNISVLGSIGQNDEGIKSVHTINIVLLVISLIAMCYFGYLLYEIIKHKSQINNNKVAPASLTGRQIVPYVQKQKND